jgi:hypothetical protein
MTTRVTVYVLGEGTFAQNVGADSLTVPAALRPLPGTISRREACACFPVTQFRHMCTMGPRCPFYTPVIRTVYTERYIGFKNIDRTEKLRLYGNRFVCHAWQDALTSSQANKAL